MDIKRRVTNLVKEEFGRAIDSNKSVKRAVKSAGKAVNSIKRDISEVFKEKTADELMAESSNRFLLIQQLRPTFRSLASQFANSMQANSLSMPDEFHIKDAVGNVRYRVIPEFDGRTSHNLINSLGDKIGYIEEPYISMGVPFLESEVEKCTVYLRNSKVCTLKKCKYEGNIYFESSDSIVDIDHEDRKNFKIQYAGKQVATLYEVPPRFGSEYMHEFIMEYDNLKVEKLCLLLAVGVNLINIV